MSALEFLSPRPADTAVTPRLRSPLERALRGAPAWIEDVSLALAKFEVRGDLGHVTHDLVPITPRRALVLAPMSEAAAVEARLRAAGASVVDMTGALAALRISGSRAVTLLRRLTDLDLDRLPAAGAIAHVAAVIRESSAETYELFWPQEYGDYLAHVVVDTAEGLE